MMTENEEMWHIAINKHAAELGRLQVDNRMLVQVLHLIVQQHSGEIPGLVANDLFTARFVKDGETPQEALERLLGI